MNLQQLYEWTAELERQFGHLKKWQVRGLALMSLGIIVTRCCVLAQMAEELGMLGGISSVNKRLKRWVGNADIDVMGCCERWTGWVLRRYASTDVVVLVDETKLGQWVGVLKISLAYGGRAIPLFWRCYTANQAEGYPQQGQVLLVWQLVARVQACCDARQRLLVQMDMGLGNSSAMLRALNHLGVDYLVRVKPQSTFTSRRGKTQALHQIAQRGRALSLAGWLFQSRMPVHLHIVWEKAYDQPWCLVTNTRHVRGRAYGYRVWQEESFRDLKSGGWHWQGARLRIPDRAERLLLAMSIAYGWILTLGSLAFDLPVALRRQLGSADDFRRYSLFRLGIRFFKRLSAIAREQIIYDLNFAQPDCLPRLC